MKSFGFDHPCGWVAGFWYPDVRWRFPKINRGKGWQVLVLGRLNIGFGWHWPPKVPV